MSFDFKKISLSIAEKIDSESEAGDAENEENAWTYEAENEDDAGKCEKVFEEGNDFEIDSEIFASEGYMHLFFLHNLKNNVYP